MNNTPHPNLLETVTRRRETRSTQRSLGSVWRAEDSQGLSTENVDLGQRLVAIGSLEVDRSTPCIRGDTTMYNMMPQAWI